VAFKPRTVVLGNEHVENYVKAMLQSCECKDIPNFFKSLKRMKSKETVKIKVIHFFKCNRHTTQKFLENIFAMEESWEKQEWSEDLKENVSIALNVLRNKLESEGVLVQSASKTHTPVVLQMAEEFYKAIKKIVFEYVIEEDEECVLESEFNDDTSFSTVSIL